MTHVSINIQQKELIMDTRKLGFKAPVFSFLVSAALILSSCMVYAADRCEIIRIRLDRAGGGSLVRIDPEKITVPTGTCTVWINFVGGRKVQVNFRENANQCILATEAATGFKKIKLDTGEECYASDALPIGKTASLVWVKSGIYKYTLETEAYKREIIATGVIEVEAEPVPEKAAVPTTAVPADTDGDGVPDSVDKCPNTPKGATVNEVGCWMCKDLKFDFDKWDIKPQYYPCLNEGAEYLKSMPDMKVEIQGHTDNIGSQEYNQRLSEKRAMAVMNYLESKGIAEERLSIKGFGFSKPIARNDTAEGRAMNRRVQFKSISE